MQPKMKSLSDFIKLLKFKDQAQISSIFSGTIHTGYTLKEFMEMTPYFAAIKDFYK